MAHNWDQPPTPAEARRWQLLAAGRQAVIDNGIAGLTVEEVVKRAGLAKGSFYTYFESRNAFLGALRYALSEDIGEAGTEAAAGSWEGLFGRVMRAAVAWQIENLRVLELFSAEYLADPSRPTRPPLVSVVERLLRAGAEAGVLRAFEGASDEAIEGDAAFAYEVIKEACTRAVANHPDDSAISAAEAFLERALNFDPKRAKQASYEPAA